MKPFHKYLTLLLLSAACAVGLYFTGPQIVPEWLPVPLLAVALGLLVVTPLFFYEAQWQVYVPLLLGGWVMASLNMAPINPTPVQDIFTWWAPFVLGMVLMIVITYQHSKRRPAYATVRTK